MLLDVPEPVWNTSMGKWSSYLPVATSVAAASIASAISGSRTPSSAFTLAAAALMRASAAMFALSIRCPDTGKFSTARWVCARHKACAGTRTSPIESCSTRYSCCSSVMSPRLVQRSAALAIVHVMSAEPPRDPMTYRVSDEDRERVAERLRRAAGDGRLTLDELDAR